MCIRDRLWPRTTWLKGWGSRLATESFSRVLPSFLDLLFCYVYTNIVLSQLLMTSKGQTTPPLSSFPSLRPLATVLDWFQRSRNVCYAIWTIKKSSSVRVSKLSNPNSAAGMAGEGVWTLHASLLAPHIPCPLLHTQERGGEKLRCCYFFNSALRLPTSSPIIFFSQSTHRLLFLSLIHI